MGYIRRAEKVQSDGEFPLPLRHEAEACPGIDRENKYKDERELD